MKFSMKKITRIVLGLLVIALLVSACSSSKSDFYKIAEQVKESDEDFSNYNEIFAEYEGGDEIPELEASSGSSYYYASIPLIKINDLYASVTVENFHEEDSIRNSIYLRFKLNDNTGSFNELEKTILGQLKKDFPKIEYLEEIMDGEVFKYYGYENEDENFFVTMTSSENETMMILDEEKEIEDNVSVYISKSIPVTDNGTE